MMEDQGCYKPTYNAADDPTNSNSRPAYTDISSITDATESSDITSILTSTFNIMVDRPEAKDAIAASMMALSQAW